MNAEKAKEIIRALADGMNPLAGEMLPEESPYNEPDVIGALFSVLESSHLQTSRKDKPKNAGLPWTVELKAELASRFRSGNSIEDLSSHFGRTKVAILAALAKQGLIDSRDE